MTLISNNSFSGMDKTISDTAVSTGNSSIDSENQEQCFGWGRRRTTTVIFGDVNVFGGNRCGGGCCGGFGF
ncbi:hypothetical protein PPL_10213 [Heterostelium album PN500]|uniref:Uncharacterized protein n=1 Tax=Heterostelium pallidum (strain ATCC 26659 / Pp 5 / PN500) TaxID=670386 RepID=D3BQM8_HETP5|nr:hypothetical protein PPL_10213 [Heterostelium album PN500]EFA76448.1 hypothetical protein PPL_10213 [Heterostelium album PN500]|eukprot:XP_020428580.1 hypothetical protein PPL_10213 [Heterostelium album PN500]